MDVVIRNCNNKTDPAGEAKSGGANKMSETTKFHEVFTWPGINEMCLYLGISTTRGYSLVWTGRVAARKIRGQWRVSPESIEKYADERRARRKKPSIVTSIVNSAFRGEK